MAINVNDVKVVFNKEFIDSLMFKSSKDNIYIYPINEDLTPVHEYTGSVIYTRPNSNKFFTELQLDYGIITEGEYNTLEEVFYSVKDIMESKGWNYLSLYLSNYDSNTGDLIKGSRYYADIREMQRLSECSCGDILPRLTALEERVSALENK